MNISNKLYNLRKQQGISQEELAGKLNVSRQTVSKWELGESIPDIENCYKICKYFDITLDELIEDNQAPNKKTKRKKLTRKILIICGIIFGALLAIDIISFIVYVSIKGLPH